MANLDTQAAVLARQRQLANLLVQQSMQPSIPPLVRGAKISPWEGISKVAQGVMGSYQNAQLDEKQSALAEALGAQNSQQAQSLLSSVLGPAQGNTVQAPIPQPQMAAPANAEGYVQSNPAPQSTPMQLPATNAQTAQQDALVKSLAGGMTSSSHELQNMAKYGLQQEVGRRSDAQAAKDKRADELVKRQYEEQVAREKELQLNYRNTQDNTASMDRTQATIQGQKDIAGMKPEPALRSFPTAIIIKPVNGVPHAFRQNPSTGYFDIDEGPAYEKPSTTDSSSDEILIQYSENGENKQGLLNRKTRKITEITTPGNGTAGAKIPEAPAAVKTQGTAAVTALKQVDNITNILRENPQLVGPVAGRMQEFMMGVGRNPFAGTRDERMGAQLAEHLNALFAQELRSMFPGRTNEQMQEMIKVTSARMKQDPNMMMGFLEGIKTNESMVLETAKAQGFVADRYAGQSPVAAPGKKSGPAVGTKQGGYVFLGGDPADQKNWKKE